VWLSSKQKLDYNPATLYQVQVGRRGVITFPKELHDQNNITDGEILNLI
jgi:hypothetical protein